MHRLGSTFLIVLPTLFFLALVAALPATSKAAVPSDLLLRDEVARGEYHKSVDDLKRESLLFPYNESLKVELAKVYGAIAERELKLGRFAEAADYYGQAQELFPDFQSFILMRGVALYFAKDYDAARAELGRAGENASVYLFQGRICYDTGDVAGAVALWRKALQLEPGNAESRKFLEKAERELPVESRMDKGYSSMFDVSFDAELPSGLSAEVMDALESAYAKVGADFGLFPRRRIPVLLYTRSDYRSVTLGPDWSGGLYDGKIRLPLGSVSKLTPQLRGILFHEYTHVLIAELTGGNIPTWLNEGLAEYEGRKEFTPSAPDLRLVGKEGKLLGLEPLTGPFNGMEGKQAGVAYQQSYSMAAFLISNYGWYTVREILKGLAERGSAEQAFKKALADWALDLAGFMEQWKKSLEQS